MNDWTTCRKILCIRADNMGDIIMMTPALRAIRQCLHTGITLLTSSQGAPVCECIPDIDEVIVADLPWVKLNQHYTPVQYEQLVQQLRALHFDGAVIFTVYSQSALPAAMLCYQAGIPLRLAYARENPYSLLTDWVPDAEPYALLRHQVERELHLVSHIGGNTPDTSLQISVREEALSKVYTKFVVAGINPDLPYLVLHTGVSEPKREYPAGCWVNTINALAETGEFQLLLTGSSSEFQRVAGLLDGSAANVFNVAGQFSIPEVVALVSKACLVVSVNTALVHIAAATNTPVVVLYALTNPQHTPWQVPNVVLPFNVDPKLKSRNEVIKFVDEKFYGEQVPFPGPESVVTAVKMLLNRRSVV